TDVGINATSGLFERGMVGSRLARKAFDGPLQIAYAHTNLAKLRALPFEKNGIGPKLSSDFPKSREVSQTTRGVMLCNEKFASLQEKLVQLVGGNANRAFCGGGVPCRRLRPAFDVERRPGCRTCQMIRQRLEIERGIPGAYASSRLAQRV